MVVIVDGIGLRSLPSSRHGATSHLFLVPDLIFVRMPNFVSISQQTKVDGSWHRLQLLRSPPRLGPPMGQIAWDQLTCSNSFLFAIAIQSRLR